MNAIQVATLFALAQKSTSDSDTKRLINELIDVIGDLANEIERQRDEINRQQDIIDEQERKIGVQEFSTAVLLDEIKKHQSAIDLLNKITDSHSDSILDLCLSD